MTSPRARPRSRLDRREALQLATLLIVALATWRILASHTALSHTVDEPTHIAAGLEWLESGTQRLHPENPPLGRIGAGLAAFLEGQRLPEAGTAPQRGTDVLYASGSYLESLRRARLATLPFFLVIVGVVWLWTDQLAGTRAAALATVAIATLPPLLGHAGLATTDVPFVAMFLLALWAWVGWLDAPTAPRALILGLALGGATATKFSTLIFFPASALLILLTLRRRETAAALIRRSAGVVAGVLLAALAAFVVVWASYRFSIGAVAEFSGAERLLEVAFPDATSLGRRLTEAMTHQPLPAPGALLGLVFLKAHAVLGHSAYLLGRQSGDGFWYFYPVALAVKTPLTFFALLLASAAGLRRRPSPATWRVWAPVAAALGMLLISMASTVNIGLRHVLAVYPLAAITLGIGLDSLLKSLDRRHRLLGAAVIAALLLWQVALVVRVYPDYLAYFNPLAGSEPGHVLVDSDLDWGQDALQLERAVRNLDIPLLHIAYFGSTRLCELDLPPLRHLEPGRRVSGWIAISEMYFRDHWRLVYPDVCDRKRTVPAPAGLSYSWLREHRPVARAGRSIRIYHLPDA